MTNQKRETLEFLIHIDVTDTKKLEKFFRAMKDSEISFDIPHHEDKYTPVDNDLRYYNMIASYIQVDDPILHYIPKEDVSCVKTVLQEHYNQLTTQDAGPILDIIKGHLNKASEVVGFNIQIIDRIQNRNTLILMSIPMTLSEIKKLNGSTIASNGKFSIVSSLSIGMRTGTYMIEISLPEYNKDDAALVFNRIHL